MLPPLIYYQKGGIIITEFENHQEHTQYTPNTFCKIVIRHAAIDAARMLHSKWKQEISLEYLSEEKYMLFSTTDEYFSQPPSSEDIHSQPAIRLDIWKGSGLPVSLSNCSGLFAEIAS